MSIGNPPEGCSGQNSLPPPLAAFLHEVVGNSLMRHDVLRFFYLNPYAILTISDLTIWLSREERPLAEALQQLATLGYLNQSTASAAFVLTSNREKRRQLDAFFDYMDAHPDLGRKIRAQLRRPVEGE